MENLRSQIVTSSCGGLRYMPTAFTEQGVVMFTAKEEEVVANCDHLSWILISSAWTWSGGSWRICGQKVEWSAWGEGRMPSGERPVSGNWVVPNELGNEIGNWACGSYHVRFACCVDLIFYKWIHVRTIKIRIEWLEMPNWHLKMGWHMILSLCIYWAGTVDKSKIPRNTTSPKNSIDATN